MWDVLEFNLVREQMLRDKPHESLAYSRFPLLSPFEEPPPQFAEQFSIQTGLRQVAAVHEGVNGLLGRLRAGLVPASLSRLQCVATQTARTQTRRSWW